MKASDSVAVLDEVAFSHFLFQKSSPVTAEVENSVCEVGGAASPSVDRTVILEDSARQIFHANTTQDGDLEIPSFPVSRGIAGPSQQG